MALTKIEPSGVNTSATFTFNASNITTDLTVSGNANVGNLASAGNISITGKLTSGAVSYANSDGTSSQVLATYGNGTTYWTTLSSSSISNGTSNVNIPSSGGNVNISAAGNANIVAVTGTGANIAGTLSVSGNITSANANLGNLVTANFYTGVLTTAAQPNVTSVGTLGSLTATGNISGGNLLGPLANGNSNVSIPTSNGNVNISSAGNANIIVITGTGANVTGTLSVSGVSNLGPASNVIITGGSNTYVLSTDGSGNLSWVAQSGGGGGGGVSLDTIVFTGNGVQNTVTVSSGMTVNTVIVSLNGVVQTPTTDYTISGTTLTFTAAPDDGDLVQIREIITSSGGGANLSNGSSNVSIATAGGNVTTSVAGNANIFVVTGTGANVNGTLSVSGNANVGNINITGNIIPTSNITYDLGNSTNLFRDLYLSGTTIKLGTQSISSNSSGVTISNTVFTTTLSATGNITAVGNIAVSSNLSVTGSISAGGGTLAAPVLVTDVQVTDSSYTVLDDSAVSTDGGYIKITGSGFLSGVNVIIGNTTATSVTFVSSTVLNVQVPAQSAGTYIVYVVNSNGSTGIRVNGLTYSAAATWVTSSPLPSSPSGSAISIQLSATGDSPFTYALAAGNSLPSGLTLTSGGLLSGTVTVVSETTYNFSIDAIDAQSQDSYKAFTITITSGDQYFDYVSSLLSASTPSSTFVTDASTNNFAMTVNGDTRPNNFNPYTPGYYSNYFDGSGDYLSIPSNSAFALTSGQAVTIETWIYINAYPGSDYASIAARVDGGGYGWYFMYNTSGVVYLGKDGSNTSMTGTIPLNTWTHVALTRDTSNNCILYLNGINVGTYSSFTSPTDTGTALTIGYVNGSYPRYPNAYFSNFRWTLSVVYSTNFTPSTAPLSAITNTSLLTCQSNRFIDNSTNNFAVTANGDSSIKGFNPFTPNSSYITYGSGYVDGSSDYLTGPDNSAFDFATGDFTVELWIYKTTTADVSFVSGSSSGSMDFAYYSNSLRFGRSYIAWDTIISYTLLTNRWYHLAFIKESGVAKIWVNGTLAGSASNSNSYDLVGNLYINLATDGSRQMVGYISDLRIVKGTAVYTSTFTPPSAPLTAISGTSLLTLQNNTPNNNNMFVDNSTNNLLITRTGDSTQGTFSPYGGGWSNYLNGSSYLTCGTTLSNFLCTGSATGITATLEAWVFVTVYNTGGSAWTFNPIHAKGNTYFNFGIRNGYVRFYWYDGGYKYVDSASSNDVPLNTWTHVAMTINVSTIKIYINGTLSTTSNTYTGVSTGGVGNAEYIGVEGNATTYYYGYISNYRFNNTVVYTTNFTPSTTPLQPISGSQLLICQSPRFVDNSANNYTVTLSGGAPTVQRFSPYSGTTLPTPYYGAYFDGTGDYLTTPTSTGFGFGIGTFTFEAWLFPTSNPGYGPGTVIDCRSGANAEGWVVRLFNNLTVGIYDGPSNAYVNSTGTYTMNAWNHIAVVRSSTSSNGVAFYINGVASGTGTISSNLGTTWVGRVGSNYSAGYDYFGYISNLRVVKGVAVYTGAFTTPTSPLSATQSSGTNISAITGTETSLLTCQSATFIDNSTNGLTITANGNSQPTFYNPFTVPYSAQQAYSSSVNGGSMYFDGTGDYITVAGVPNVSSAQNWALSAWVYPTYLTPSYYNRFFGGTDLNMGQYNGTWYLTNTSVGLISATAVVVNAWTHVAVINKASTGCYIYINGVLGGSGGAQSFTMGSCKIGTDSSASTNWYGYVSDLQIITNASAPLYSSNFVPPSAPATAIQNVTTLISGTSAGIYDSSMMNNTVTFGTAIISTSTKKYGTGSIYVNGNSNSLYTPVFVPTLGSGDWTLEMWLNTTATDGSLCGQSSGASNPWAILFIGGSLYFQNNTQSSNVLTAVSVGNLLNGSWHHLALVKNNGTTTCYVDGVSKASAADSTNYASTNPLKIGGTTHYLYGGFTAYIDDFRITRGYARYTSNFTPNSSPFLQS